MIKKIWIAYQYLFYKFHMWDIRAWGKSGDSPRQAWFSVSLICFIYFLIFSTLLHLLTGYDDQIFNFPKPLILLVMGVFLIPNYFIFMRNQKYKRILKKFENESRRSRIL